MDILVPTLEGIECTKERLAGHGISSGFDGATLTTRDPWGNEIALAIG